MCGNGRIDKRKKNKKMMMIISSSSSSRVRRGHVQLCNLSLSPFCTQVQSIPRLIIFSPEGHKVEDNAVGQHFLTDGAFTMWERGTSASAASSSHNHSTGGGGGCCGGGACSG